MFKGLQWKIVLIYSLLLLFAQQLIGVYMMQSLENYYLKNYFISIEAQAKLLSTFLTPGMLEEEGDSYVAHIVEGFRGTKDLDIIVLDRYSRVVGASGNSEMAGQRIMQEEITRALARNPGEVIRVNPENEQRYYYLAYPVSYEGYVVGVIYLSGSLENIDRTLGEIKGIFITGSIVVLSVGFLIGLILTRTITSPIQEVTRKAEQMAGGDFSQRIAIRSEDEIGHLAKMFNFLASRLNGTLQEISSEKSKVEAVLNYMSDGILGLDGSGTVIHVNPAARKLLAFKHNYRLEVGSYGFDLLTELVGVERLNRFNRDKRSFTMETTVEEPYKVLQVSLAPFKEEEGGLNGILVVLHDITGEKEISRRQQDFVANVSHELSTPLTSMKSYLEALQDGAMMDPPLGKRFLDVVSKQTDHMIALVKDLLVLSRLDARKEELNRVSVDINGLIKEITDQIKFKHKCGPALELALSPDLPPAFINRERYYQVLVNILNNSLKYTPAEGKIEVISESREGWIYVTIKDTGIGIPEEELPLVFNRFYRVDKTRSRDSGGTGLGLSIAKQVIEAYGGTIEISSKPNHGTAVSFSIPIHSAEGIYYHDDGKS